MKCFVICLLISLSVPAIRAIDIPATRRSLRGVDAFNVVVDLQNGNALGLTNDEIQTDVELRCRQAGVKIDKTLIQPDLYVNVQVMQLQIKSGQRLDGYAVNIEVEFDQSVTLDRAPAMRVPATTWAQRR